MIQITIKVTPLWTTKGKVIKTTFPFFISLLILFIRHTPKTYVLHTAVFGAFHPSRYTVARAVTVIAQKRAASYHALFSIGLLGVVTC